MINNNLEGSLNGTNRDQVSAQRNGSNSLQQVKKARKQIETDAQLLANRIALLKQEELKSWKKIEETKKKAREVFVLKKKNEDKQMQKQNKQANENTNLKETQVQSAEIRKKRQLEKQNLREALMAQKHQEMQEIKRQQRVNEARKKEAQNKLLQDNKMKHKQVKNQQMIGQLRKREYEENKMRLFRMEHERRMAEEEAVKQQKELEVLNMEKLEMELIKKLQHTQMLQKSAYEELEVALAEEPEEYERKFLNASEYGGKGSQKGFSRTETPNQQNQNLDGEEDANASGLQIQGRPQGAQEEMTIQADDKANIAGDEQQQQANGSNGNSSPEKPTTGNGETTN